MNSTNKNDPVTSEMKVAISLRFMGDKKLKSLADIFGIGFKAANRALHNLLEAVNKSVHQGFDVNLFSEK